MVRRKKNVLDVYGFPILILFTIISTSIGYGLWSGHLTVHGKIYTGNLNLDFKKVCIQSLCCGCSSNMTYLWDRDNVDVNLTYTYNHCKLLIIVKIANDGTVPGVVKKLYVSELGNNTHIYTLFIDDPSNVSADHLSYPMELENGWNVITPHNIKLEPGEYVYMAILIVFDGSCGCSCIDHNSQESDIQIHIPWRVPGACIGSWESNQDITITSDYS